MATIIFVVIFVFFTNIFAYNPECEKESFCECSEKEIYIHDFFISIKGVKFGIKVKSWSDVQINCEFISWKYVNFTREQKRYKVDSVKFDDCPLPDETSLKDIVTKLGIIEENKLSFKSYRNLSESLKKEHFQGFSNVTELVLSHNGLTNISSDFFRNFPNLRVLDLSENSLVLSNDTFNETLNLKQLDLHNNVLTELPFYVFHNLQNLRTLNLQRNFLNNLNEKIFEKLSSLKHLNLSNNWLQDLQPTIFYNLEKLETIDLSNNYFSNLSSVLFSQNKKLNEVLFYDNKASLPTLPGDLLTDLENFEKIHLRNNGFRSLPKNIFWGSTSLKNIDLGWNFLEELPELIFYELVHIEVLYLNNNLIEMLPDEIFKYFKYIEILDLAYNRIAHVQSKLFYGLTSLRELYMEGNGMIYIDGKAFSTNEQLSIANFSNNLLTFKYENGEKSPFYNNRRLQQLHLAKNMINHFHPDYTVNKRELELLDLSDNNIRTISADYFIFTSNKFVVNLRHNNIYNILLDNIEKLATYNTERRDIIIFVKNNPILCDCNLYHLLRYSNGDMPITVYNFFELRLGNVKCVKPNGIEGPQINQLNFKTYQCPEDEFFQIAKNCPTMCSCNIRPYDRVRVFDCSYNKISVFRIDKNNMNSEGTYPLILNLTGNNLRFIPPLDDLKSFNLTHLLLSNNKISEISLDRLPKTIEVLELHNNYLFNLNYEVSEYLFNQNYKKLTLSGNPFECDCDTRYLYLLVLKMQNIYKDLQNVKCKDQNIRLVDITVDQLCPSNVPPEKIIKTMEYNETLIGRFKIF